MFGFFPSTTSFLEQLLEDAEKEEKASRAAWPDPRTKLQRLHCPQDDKPHPVELASGELRCWWCDYTGPADEWEER